MTGGNMPDQLEPRNSESVEVRQRRGTWRRWLWAVIVIVVVAAGIFLVVRHRPKPQAGGARAGMGQRGGMAQGPVMVSAATAQKGDIGVYVTALGLVTPVNTVAVKSRVDGQLVQVHYQEGQVVQSGDALVEIDARPFEAALAQVEGQLARDTALLENAR